MMMFVIILIGSFGILFIYIYNSGEISVFTEVSASASSEVSSYINSVYCICFGDS